MERTRRRVLMAGGALGLAASSLSGCGQGVTPPGPASGSTGGCTSPGSESKAPAARVRYDVSSAQGQAMLEIYAQGVASMKALPPTDPRSWTFQWYSHWVQGDEDQTGKTAQLAAVFGPASSPEKALAQLMWNGCQAHGDNEDENFFLPWHRLFLMAFENIVRALTGQAGFTLPYWNYLEPAHAAIPAQFRMANDLTWGALYNPERNIAVNAGGAIAAASDLSAEILSETSYSPAGADQGFCANLDLGLHGLVHVGVGNAADGMGVIPWAANDPIFWLHHCNIDRLWASWNAAGNANPCDDSFIGKPFTFADPNGARFDTTVAQALSLQQAGYGYDVLIGANGQPLGPSAMIRERPQAGRSGRGIGAASAAITDPPMNMSMPMASAPRTPPSITHVVEGVKLGGSTSRVRLRSTRSTPEVSARTLAPMLTPPVRLQHRPTTMAAAPPPASPSLASQVMSLFRAKPAAVPAPAASPPLPTPAEAPLVPAPKPGQKVFLVLGNLTTDVQPGVIYRIYLDAPTKTGGVQPCPVGALTFFSAMPASAKMAMASRSRSYNITALAKTLAAQGRLEESPALSFVPAGKPVGEAQPLIGSISLAIQ